MRREIFINILLIISLTACAKSNENGRAQSNSHNNIMTTCEIHSTEYGTISCGQIPLSVKSEINNRFEKKCHFQFEKIKIKNKDIECLERNKFNSPDGYALGFYKYFGVKVKRDKNEGFKLINQAAENSYPEALTWLSVYYTNQQNFIKSFELMKISAELGYPLAMYGLGHTRQLKEI